MADRFLYLDGIRGLAAFTVVLEHAGYTVPENAVDAFFVLSAFLLTVILYTKAEKLLKNNANIKQWLWMLLDYFIRRFLRVYPGFLVTAIMVSTLTYRQQQEAWFLNGHGYDLWQVITFDYRPHVFWTLPVEMEYYFVIPLYVAVILLVRRWWILIVLAVTVKTCYADWNSNRYNVSELSMHINTFLNGSSLAFVYVKLKSTKLQKTVEENKYLAWALDKFSILFAVFVLSVGYKRIIMTWLFNEKLGGGYPFSSIFLSILLCKECLLPGTVAKFFEWNFLLFAGKISFSLYLNHSFALYLWDHQTDPVNFFFFLVFAAFGFSYLTYLLVEYPVGRLSNYISQWIKRQMEASKPFPPDNVLLVWFDKLRRKKNDDTEENDIEAGKEVIDIEAGVESDNVTSNSTEMGAGESDRVSLSQVTNVENNKE
ncbi:hypothetical protein HDV01_000878 [Terramyces sp. JEL0728]|nr:hypothetical protein HDV01_000878 [Terramyces sp. JEL0728]